MPFELLYALKRKKFWWIDILFYFFIAFFFLTIIFYFVLDIGVSAQRHKIEKLSQDIEKFGTEEQKEIEKQIFDYQKKIAEVSELVKLHKIPSNFFELIEKTTLPEVYFPTVTLSTENFEINLRGQTENLENLAKQLAVLRENENIKDIKRFETKLGEEAKVTFNLTLLLSPELFLWK